MACTDNENSGANFKDEMNEGTSFRTQTSNSNDWTDDETRENATRLLQSSNNHDLEQQINVDGPDENENEVTETRGVQTQETIDNMEFVGKEFATEDEADHFYHEYAKFVGFGVRRNTKRYDKQGMLTGRQWVCSKQGFRPQKYLRLANRSREARPLTRTGCRVEFRISLNERKTAWKYEQQAADVYTKAVFYMVREEIDKEGLLTATLIEEDMLSKTYQVKKFGNQHKEHTAENLPEIPNCMILSRWRKDAKLEVIPSEFVNDVAQYMSVEARVGSIHTACRGKSIDAYNMAIIDIHKLSLRLEGMCSIAEPSGRKGERQRAPLVKDPVVVLTKGAAKKLKVRPTEQRKCKKCREGGHTVPLGTSSDILLQQNGDSMLGESLDHMQVDLIGSNFPNSQYSTTSDINDYINIWNYTDF
ncbi:hypothetical protein CUMW_240240 [Citrus unshiu]|uniref:FAR1 domain-containing protein n=1 Tax=Citrus unshiu TaxID=55188 RepID=A0A2H5QM56_CITUN|nr:hypothetical protein CUMW_240240 [Citrus unshiu]